jgi:hypothetical protein
MLDASQPPVRQEPEEGDGMEEAIGKFFDGLEGQERRGFMEMH